jgi:DNA-binding transcriptional LysR family regulator
MRLPRSERVAALELRHLRYFIAVAEHLNFTRAAEALHTAQPSLSRQIRSLECELNMVLFERTPHSITLTAEGHLLLAEARAIIERVDALSSVYGGPAVPRGLLRIASITASTIGILPNVLPPFRENFPNVEAGVETWSIEDGVRALIDRRVDVAFARHPLNDERLDSIVVAGEHICVALPSGHPLLSLTSVPVRLLDGLDFVGMRDGYTGDFNRTMAEVFRQHGTAVRSTIWPSNVETLLGLVASGMGVAVASAVLKAMLVQGLELRPLEPRIVLKNLCLAWRRDRAALPAIRAFRDHVLAAELAF